MNSKIILIIIIIGLLLTSVQASFIEFQKVSEFSNILVMGWPAINQSSSNATKSNLVLVQESKINSLTKTNTVNLGIINSANAKIINSQIGIKKINSVNITISTANMQQDLSSTATQIIQTQVIPGTTQSTVKPNSNPQPQTVIQPVSNNDLTQTVTQLTPNNNLSPAANQLGSSVSNSNLDFLCGSLDLPPLFRKAFELEPKYKKLIPKSSCQEFIEKNKIEAFVSVDDVLQNFYRELSPVTVEEFWAIWKKVNEMHKIDPQHYLVGPNEQ